MSRDNQSDKNSRSQNPSMKPSTSSQQPEIFPPFPLPPAPTITRVCVRETVSTASPGVVTNVEKERTKIQENSCKNDFYAILDQFTETSDEELNRINHMLIGESGTKSRGYKCLKCELQCKYFTQAKKHHSEHEFTRLAPVRELIKRAALEQQSYEQDIAKFEKAVGTADKKRLVRALRTMNENLHKNLEALDGLEKTKLPEHLRKLCKDFTRSLMAISNRADKVIDKLGK